MITPVIYQEHDYNLFINGQWRPGTSGQTVALVNPANEKVIGQVAKAQNEDIDLALQTAQTGFEHWQSISLQDRAAILNKAAENLSKNIDTVALALTQEQGKTLAESKGELVRAIETIQWTAQHALTDFSKQYQNDTVQRYTVPTPVGVVAAFVPWNYPAVLCARKLAPALVAGCSVILKAAEETPSAAVAIVDAFEKAGLPKGVITLLFGEPAQISERLLASPVIRKLTFTGSTAIGKLLARQASENLIPCILELGGHAPMIIDDTVNITDVAKALSIFKFRCAGQGCNVPSRVYVHQTIYEEFLAELTKIASSLTVGDGMNKATDIGPMNNNRRIETMLRLTDDAVSKGARLVIGGKPLQQPGYFWPPTILTDVPDDALILQEEPFGPILCVIAFSSLDEAIAKANDSEYGLAGYGFTQSTENADKISKGLKVGYVGMNILSGVPENAPVCGIKSSGYGLEGGLAGIEAYTYPKLVTEQV